MATKHTHFHGETPVPDRGHAKGSNSFGYHPKVSEVNTPQRMTGTNHGPDTGNPVQFGQSNK